MAQINKELYKDIAEAYASIDGNLGGIAEHARTAVDAILDVTTTNYPDPSVDADAALEIEIELLSVFNTAYVASQNIAASTGSLLDAVRAVNNHVINNTSGSSTATVKLALWVNTEMTSTWTAGTPTGWKNLSEDAGYTVTSWT
jgi:hypothetical protein